MVVVVVVVVVIVGVDVPASVVDRVCVPKLSSLGDSSTSVELLTTHQLFHRHERCMTHASMVVSKSSIE